MVVAAGCAVSTPERRPAEPGAPPPRSEQPRVHGCAHIRAASPPGRPPPVSLEALRSLVDAPDGRATRALLDRLGRPTVSHDQALPGISHLDYEDIGLRLELRRAAGEPLLKSAEFSSSVGPGWAGPLPAGLSFAMNVEDTFRAAGPPDEKRLRTYAHMPHHVRARGLLFRFDTRGCLSAVAFVTLAPA